MDHNIVKALRRKCNDMEDELDAEVEAKDEALAAKVDLEKELVRLCEEIRTETEAQQLAEVIAGQGIHVLERLQKSLEEERQRTVTLEKECETARTSKQETAQKLQDLLSATSVARERIGKAEEELKQVEAVCATAEEQERSAKVSLDEERAEAESSQAKCAEWRQRVEAAQERLQAAKTSREELSSRLETLEADGRGLEAREAVVAEERCARKASLQETLEMTKSQVRELLEAQDAVQSMRQELESELQDVSAVPDASSRRLAVLEEELEVAAEASKDLVARASQAERELQEARQASETADELCRAVGVELEAANGRVQEVERAAEDLEQRVAETTRHLKEQEVAMTTEINSRAEPLQTAFNEAYEQRMNLDWGVADLRATRHRLEEQLRLLDNSRNRLQSQVCQVQADIQATTEAEVASQNQIKTARDALIQEQQMVAVSEQLEEELHAWLQEVSQHQELRGHCGTQEQARADEEERLQVLSRELASEQDEWESKCITARSEELAKGVEELSAAGQHGREAITALEQDVEVERRQRMADMVEHEEFRSLCERLREETVHATDEVTRHTEELEAEGLRRVEQEEACVALEADTENARHELEGMVHECGRVEEELSMMVQARDLERKRVEELQERFAAVQPEHTALFARYSEVIEQIDVCKSEKRKLASEAERLRVSIAKHRGEADEARRRQEAVESAPPAQVTVSDVLISVHLEGATAPLELRPWDTNFESVVSEWLATEQKTAELQQGLVRYLRHLEDTAETFPVKAEAKLHEVHEQFAY